MNQKKSSQTHLMNRRNFLKKVGVAATALSVPMILPSRLLGNNSPSNKITLGFIGMGWQGSGRNLGTFLYHTPDAKVLAVCDVNLKKAQKAKQMVDEVYQNSDCDVYQDFRDVIGRKDIDAIVISTPDHWHVPMSIAALQAGKDVFCEKPTLTISGGQKLVKEVKKHKAVFQWGIEDRSIIRYHRMAGWVRGGMIGKLKTVHVSLPRVEPFLKEQVAPVPNYLDYNMWLGPAPFAPYTENRTEIWNWRMITDYSGGMITDWGSHLVDTAQVGAKMEDSGPIEISGSADKLDQGKYQSDAPVGFKLHYRYPNGVEMFVEEGAVDIKFVGTEGWVRCENWDGTWSASDMDIIRIKDFGKEAGYWPRPPIEHQDFLNSVKSRKRPSYHVEAGHRLSTTLHLGHIAIRTGKTIKWDPVKEMFIGDDLQHFNSMIYKRPERNWEINS